MKKPSRRERTVYSMDRKDMVDAIYHAINENIRLTASRQGQLEYLTTMHYIHQLVPAGTKVLEVGAGTGRYSIALARKGYQVTAVELLEHNLQTLRQQGEGVEGLRAFQGDATDLSRFADHSFDAVLVFGPMYHLYDAVEKHMALDEALRVTRPGGVAMFAFLSVYAILYNNYLCGRFQDGIRENFDAQGRVRHFQEQGFTGFDVGELESLFADKPVQKMALVGTDSVLELAQQSTRFQMSDEEFQLFAAHHLACCEKRELLGTQSHLLYICRKNG